MYYLSFSKIRLLISSILILAFFLHGFLYYFFPEDILNSDSPIKLIKYIIVFLFLIANINKVNFARVYIFIFWAVLFLCFYLIANPLVNGKINVIEDAFFIDNMPVVDEDGNVGNLNASVYHTNYLEWNYNLFVNLDHDPIKNKKIPIKTDGWCAK